MPLTSLSHKQPVSAHVITTVQSASPPCISPLSVFGTLGAIIDALAGNFCEGGRRGRTPGNGRIVVTQFNNLKGDDCAWDVVKVLHVPETAYFDDYSGMAFRGNTVCVCMC